MTILSYLSLDEARQQLVRDLRAAIGRDPAASICRAEVEIEPVDCLPWLTAQGADHSMYWSDRINTFEVAATGECDRLWYPDRVTVEEVFAAVHERLDGSDPEARYYGGIAFVSDACEKPREEKWKPFGAARFSLPRLELIRREKRTFLACNMRASAAGGWEEEIAASEAALASMVATTASVPILPPLHLVRRHHQPEMEGWNALFERVVDALRSGSLEKVVLARCSTCELDRLVTPAALLSRLAAITPNCFHFAFQYNRETAFIGATPELLCSRRGRHVCTEAIAGTRRRGVCAADDDRLGHELLTSDKDRREHGFVVDSVEAALAPLCHAVERDAVGLLKLANVQHLCQHMSAELNQGASDADLVAALHPTPAVGGWPTDAARDLIGVLEPFDRGWYAGPVGWIGAGGLQLGVGIRSGLLSGRSLSLYSGAGLVRDSVAEQEWQEIEDKLSSFIKGLLHYQGGDGDGDGGA